MEFTLRKWSLDDLDSLVKYANNAKIAQFMPNRFPHPYQAKNGIAFIRDIATAPNNWIYAISINGQAVGGVGLHPQADILAKNAEIGYWLAEPFWGQGIMSKAVLQIIDIGFGQLDINRIFGRCFGTNIASQAVLKKTGFLLEAKFKNTIYKNGIYLDELIYAIRK